MGFVEQLLADGGFQHPTDADFVAVDVETANAESSSMCALGVAVVKDGNLVACGEQLLDPRQDFDPYNTMIHGIDESDVEGQPTLPDVWPSVAALLDGQNVVAHWASFDMRVFQETAAFFGIDGGPTFEVYDTCRMARRTWPTMESFSLGFIAPEFGIEFDHHVAGEDARACAELLMLIREATGITPLVELSEHLMFRPGVYSPVSYGSMANTRRYENAGSRNRAALRSTEGEEGADPDHPMYGLALCFTGTLASMPRRQAIDEITQVGADFKSGVSKKLNVLVIGDGDFEQFVGGWETNKLKKAKELSAQGVEIEIMAERDFLKMLAGG